jgi:hypothetical protein
MAGCFIAPDYPSTGVTCNPANSEGVVLLTVTTHRRGVWFDFILFYFRNEKNFIVSTFAPNTISGSNPGTGRRFEHNRLARWGSRHPFAAKQVSRLLRRQMLRIFEHMLDPNRQVTPPCPTSRAQCKAAA